MAYPILTTKVSIPPLRTDLVHRPHIIEHLNNSSRGKLTMVSAPAGFGKTTAIVEWLNSVDRPKTWITLEQSDNEVSRFLAYLISAFQTLDESFKRIQISTPLIPQAPSDNAILSELINAIAAYQGNPILVLDDYHHIENQEVHDLVNYFLKHQPPNLHIVIASRYDPPLQISLLRAQGQMIEIRSEELRFTKQEISKLLNEILALGLESENIDMLVERTEGWIASLQLLALSLQGRADKGDFVASFSGGHHYLVDYLVDEILVNQPEEIQTFLYRTSIFDRFCAPLCDAVMGGVNSRKLLRKLEKSNLLLIPLDNERVWYRYHHLFADCLKQRINENQPEILPELHRKAGEWFKGEGLFEEAIIHGIQAEDYDFVVDLIEEYADVFLWHGDHATLQRWLSTIPEHKFKSRPLLSISFAITDLMAGRSEEIEKKLLVAETALESITLKSDKKELQGIIAAIRASSAFLISGNVSDTIKFSQQALKLLPENNATWRTVVALDSGDAHTLSGNLEAAEHDYHQAAASSKRGEHVFLYRVSSAKLANNFLARGHLKAGAETIQQAIEFTDTWGMLETPRTPLLFTILADIQCEWNQLTEALKNINKGIAQSEEANNLLAAAWGHRTLAKILFSSGELAAANKAIGKLESLARRTKLPSYILTSLLTWKVRIEIAKSGADKSRLELAERLLQEQEFSLTDDKFSYDSYLRQFSQVRLLIAQQKFTEAIRNIDRLMEITEAWGYTNGLIELLILKSLTFYLQNEKAQAIAVLEDALSKAEPEGYVRLFVDEGEPIAALLQRIRDKGIFLDYIDSLLAAFKETGGIEPLQLQQTLIEQLSKRELEILNLLSTELSVPDIADQLMVSANTVRTHTRNIYAKLEVHNRRSAVRRAQELKLI